MERAAVLIGVKKTGELDLLPAARAAAQAMAQWAQAQKIPLERIKTILDDTDAVTIARIRTAVQELADTFVVQQLLIYFCGHGVYTRGSEFWLLSGAPDIPEEAVNLASSADFARQSTFPHVIFISDACRTAAVGLQNQQISGSSIFLNPKTTPEQEASVDQFFACALNTASNQTRTPGDAKATFQSIYTNTLIAALDGKFAQAVCIGSGDDHSARRRVHPWPLKTLLRTAVPEAIRKAGLPLNAYQTPDARICSEPTTWLADLAPLDVEKRADSGFADLLKGVVISTGLVSSLTQVGTGGLLGGLIGGLAGFSKTGPPSAPASPPPLVPQPMDAVLALTLDQRFFKPFKQIDSLPESALSTVDVTVKQQAIRLVAADLPTESHFETGMGFRIHNATLVEAVPLSSAIDGISQSADAAIVSSATPTANVLLVFSDGRGTVLPAIAGVVVSLIFEEVDGMAELVSLSYEPMDPFTRIDPHYNPATLNHWQDMKMMAETARENRALIAALTRSGIFRLDLGTADSRANAELLGKRLQSTKTYDPSMAIYAAYAYYDLQRIDLIQRMATYFVGERGLMLFDLALLTRSLTLESGALPAVPVFPFFPMLSRGWSLMESASIRLPAELGALERHVTNSLWTLFDAEGVARIRGHIPLLEAHYEKLGFRPRQSAAGTRPR